MTTPDEPLHNPPPSRGPIHKLTPARVAQFVREAAAQMVDRQKPRKLIKIFDGGSMYLEVRKGGSCAWIVRVKLLGKWKSCKIGSYPYTTLSEARAEAAKYKKLAASGIDPIEHRNLEIEKVMKVHSLTFQAVASECYKAYLDSGAWQQTTFDGAEGRLRNHFSRTKIITVPLGDISVVMAGEALVQASSYCSLTVVQKLKTEIRVVASYAVGKGYIKDRILEELRAPLELKAKFRQLNREEGRPAILDLEILGAVLHKDISSEGSWQVKAAHRCCAMTFVRSGVVCAMRWDELDLERRVWSIPREKMKTKHRPADSPGWTQRYVDIPLSTQMVALLKGLPRHGDYVFPSLRHGSDCLGQNSLEKHLNQVLGLANQHSPHSYRSTFSTWANEQSTPELNRLYERESIELALDHAVKGLVEKLYDRSRTLERIRPCVQGFSDALEAAENRAASIHRASQDALRAIDSASAAGQVLH